jgi:MFS transporter, DHA2 family, glioxin efflux transporter
MVVGKLFPADHVARSAVFQMMGGTMCISAGQSIFGNTLLQSLRNIAPQIDAATVVTIGASDLRQALPADQIEVVLISYMAGLRNTFALGIAIAGCAFVCSWIAPILSIKKANMSPAEAMALKA